jgi:hypothetical protein
MSERYLLYGEPDSDAEYCPVHHTKRGEAGPETIERGRMPLTAFELVPDEAEHVPGEIFLAELDAETHHDLFDRIDWWAYAESGETICRFPSETDRDHWVDMSPEVRDADPDPEKVERLEQLAKHGLAQWRGIQDATAGVRYEIADLVIPARVAHLPAGDARAYWLCEHPRGPQLFQHEAADILDTTQGSISTQVKRAGEKLQDDHPP